MRRLTVALGLGTLLAAAPLAAQGPTLKIVGAATPGATVSIDLTWATAGALAVLVHGYAPGVTPIGTYATLGIRTPGLLVVGPVPALGAVSYRLRLPKPLPPGLVGTSVYFQYATLRLGTGPAEPRVVVKVTGVGHVVVESAAPGGLLDR